MPAAGLAAISALGLGPEWIYVCMEPPSTTHPGDCMVCGYTRQARVGAACSNLLTLAFV